MNGSIVEEDSRIYLKTLYDAEENIATILSDMLCGGHHQTFPVDFTCSPLDVLSSDSDQVKRDLLDCSGIV